MNIGIIGYGVVGKAVAKTLTSQYKVIKYDKYADFSSFKDLKQCEIVFITVPTPFDVSSNSLDDSAVRESLCELDNMNFKGVVLIKSTLPPGFCDNYSENYKLELVYNPEFLRESTTPNEDFKNQDCVVIGTINSKSFDVTKKMYEKVLLSEAIYYHTTFREAEMIKYAQNTMLASRVALANMIYDACIENSVNYEIIRKIAFDSFEILGPSMVQVPGPDGKFGFGGKCLPKDIMGFSTIHDSNLLKEIIAYNESKRNDLHKFLHNFKK